MCKDKQKLQNSGLKVMPGLALTQPSLVESIGRVYTVYSDILCMIAVLQRKFSKSHTFQIVVDVIA